MCALFTFLFLFFTIVALLGVCCCYCYNTVAPFLLDFHQKYFPFFSFSFFLCFLFYAYPFTVAVVVCFCVCWAPFHAQRLVAFYGNNQFFVYAITTYVSGILYYLSTCINPLLYNIMSNKFREAFKVCYVY